MNPQFLDERSQAARQMVPRLKMFARVSIVIMVVQSLIVAVLLVLIYQKKTDAYGVTQSGIIFKLEPHRK